MFTLENEKQTKKQYNIFIYFLKKLIIFYLDVSFIYTIYLPIYISKIYTYPSIIFVHF